MKRAGGKSSGILSLLRRVWKSRSRRLFERQRRPRDGNGGGPDREEAIAVRQESFAEVVSRIKEGMGKGSIDLKKIRQTQRRPARMNGAQREQKEIFLLCQGRPRRELQNCFSPWRKWRSGTWIPWRLGRMC